MARNEFENRELATVAAKFGASLRVPMPRVLSDMRQVYRQRPEKDKTPAQRQLRLLMQEDLKGFLSQLGTLEKEYNARRLAKEREVVKGVTTEPEAADNPPEMPETLPADDGSVRVDEVIGRLLAEAVAATGDQKSV